MKRVAEAIVFVKVCTAENGSLSVDMLVADLDENGDSNYSAKTTLKRGSSRAGDENAFKKAVAHCLVVE